MIPSLVVDEVRSALVSYLASTFALTDDGVRDALTDFLQSESEGIFRGPYLRVRTPFVEVDDEWMASPPLDWLPSNFRPYAHQAQAFDRLSSRDRQPEPTIVTTGTGSGKTECFLYPILDHCARMSARGKDGIKAIILYPMNALATDQANRIAKEIASNPELAGVTAGLFIGGEGGNSSMSAEHIIDNNSVLRSNPPDILLTNYKMLDYLLLRSSDRDLWAVNELDTLRYVVLDEFHTYDGAQGTDVAMLLRRLGKTLKVAEPGRPLGVATPVATSATLASGHDALRDLRDFAEKVFGTSFDADSIIHETRKTVDEVCPNPNYDLEIPSVDDVLQAHEADDVAAVFCTARPIDGEPVPAPSVDDVIRLGVILHEHPLTRAVLTAVGPQPRSWNAAVSEIVRNAPEWGRTFMREPDRVSQALARFLWLISIARRKVGGRRLPLFTVEVQLWVREVSRLLRAVDREPSFRWVDSSERSHDDRPLPELELPAVSCRRCGMAGWMAIRSELSTTFQTNPASIYRQAVNKSPAVRTMILTSPDEPGVHWFDPANRSLVEGPDDQGRALPVLLTATDEDAKADTCPACGERDAIRFLGLRVASLTSVSINTLFASEHVEREERKLLAFTDSVQDASHRASFFAGRTHRINLRTIMARAIKEREQLTLDDLGDELYLRAESPEDRYAVTPPDLLRDPAVRTVWTERPKPHGLAILQRRLRFEADLELGLRTRVGRTLELSNAVAAHVPVSDEVLDLVYESVEHATGSAPDPTLTARWTRGLLERLRLKGAIENQLLEPFVIHGGQQWHVWGGRPPGLPPFAPGIGRPTFATTAAKGDFDSLTALATTKTWFVDWTTTVLGVDGPTARDLNIAFFALLASSTEIVESWGAPNGRVFGLARAAIEIHDLPDDEHSAGLQCTSCGGRHVAPLHTIDEWVGSTCLRYRCPGVYEANRGRPTDYYRSLYRRGITRRVVTGEHTGLLGRSEREALEERFKTGTAPDDENVLTATPTLEMGIDIGDLSAVMLTSVPRNPAAYLQRVGRAGRATGNSLVATFVPSDRHGLYYLAEPESMLAGEVRPPNCYLDALDTLKRQYIAYLIDRTADKSLDAPQLPRETSPLMNSGLDEGGLFRIIIDASEGEHQHINDFLGLFRGQLADDTIAELHHFATSGVEARIKDGVERWLGDVREMSNRIKRLNTAIEKAEKIAKSTGDDTELSGLLGQRRAISGKVAERRRAYPLSELGRLGLLPNYTLVEDDVTLSASLWSRDDNDDYVIEEWEYQRSGSLAVREFAPGNSFYAGGHRHIVDALEVGGIDEPDYETWRLCPECGFGTPEDAESSLTACPRCGEAGIMGVQARHRMLKLRQVSASGSEETARVFDESDNRKQERFEVVRTVDVDPTHVQRAWKLAGAEAPAFGAELARNTVLRTINFGFAEKRGAQVPVAGKERKVTNFVTCAHCGTAQDVNEGKRPATEEGRHQGWCKVRSGAISKRDAFRDLVLYHELVTDAVRMLLPVSMFEVNERLASFKGALLLGLRRDFGGDPDHLRIQLSDMPNRDGQGRRNFLVLYDNVPGGTGYLQRLADPNRVRQILEQAQDLIAHCPCQNEGRQACHRCLLGVVERNEYDLVSRELALRLIGQLLDDWQTEPIATVAGIELGRTEESELERRFKVALQDWCERSDHEHLTMNVRAGRGSYQSFELRVDHSDGTALRWHIDEQEGLSRHNTIPDFMIKRVDDRSPSVAIYLDGFQFHASATNPNMGSDSSKRASVRADGTRVWCMTWEDVELFHSAAAKETNPGVKQRPLLEGQALNIAKGAHAQRGARLDYALVNRNPVELLLEYLSDPDADAWEDLALSTLTGVLGDAGEKGNIDSASAIDAVTALADGELPTWVETGDYALGGVSQTMNGLPIGVALRLEEPNAMQLITVLSLPDDAASIASDSHRARWHDWLQWSNIVQFMNSPGRDAIVTATESAHDEIAETYFATAATIASPFVDSSPSSQDVSTDQQRELEALEFSDIADAVQRLLVAGAPDFEAGAEVDGLVLEAAWLDAKVAIVPESWPHEAPGSWRIITADAVRHDELLTMLNGEN